MDFTRLIVKGLTYSERPSNAYALILVTEDESKRLPIVIGAFEAQSIAIALDRMSEPPRPMTHDLFYKVLEVHHIDINQVLLHKIDDGVFYAQIEFNRDGQTEVIDARPSDAISLAIRASCPIYATQQVMDAASMDPEAKRESAAKPESPVEPEPLKQSSGSAADPIRSLSIEQLNELLQRAIAREDYELAAAIRDEIDKRDTE